MSISLLKIMAEDGSVSAYRASRILKAPYSTVYEALRSLEEKGLVQLLRVNVNVRGVASKIYGLTLRGMMEALAACKPRKISGEWSSLDPLLFGKLGHIARHVSEAEALEALWEAAGECLKSREVSAACLRRRFYCTPFTQPEKFSIGGWIEALKSDREVKSLAIEALEGLAERLKNQITIVEEALQTLRGD